MNIQHSYLFHRFQVCNDNFEWKNILLTVPNLGPIFHLDFSENITNTPKFEPQSAHFSKKQFSLHCSVMHSCSQDFPQYQYFYHFSDVIRHDFYFSITVIKDLLTYIENLDMDIYRLKSDNCSIQYKCRYFFPLIRSIAIEKNKIIIFYYGVSGHGKGLVDAMSGFGVKTPLRLAIVTNDFFYNNSKDICDYLKLHCQADNRKYCHLETIERYENPTSLPLPRCLKVHVIAYHPDGSIQTKENICSCNNCLTGNLINCVVEKGSESLWL